MKTLQLQEIMDCVQLPSIITMQEQGFSSFESRQGGCASTWIFTATQSPRFPSY